MRAQLWMWRLEAVIWLIAWVAITLIGAYKANVGIVLGALLCLMFAASTLREILIAKRVYKNELYRELARRDLARSLR